MKRMLLLLCLLALAVPALAQVNDPLLSLKRLNIGLRVDREMLQTYATEDLAWVVALPIAYNLLSPQPGEKGLRFSLTLRPEQSLDLNERPKLWVGGVVTLYRGAP
jgi:hypothetical protein